MPSLISADLRYARLRGADLRGAVLTDADLRDARLGGANLSKADLRGAVLTGAAMRGNVFDFFDAVRRQLGGGSSGWPLPGADLTEATLGETVFGNVDLSNVIGLDTCRHRGPSIIDHRTLKNLKPLPLSFLRGAGLPEELIKYLPSIFSREHYSLFISYSSKDEDFAERIHADLQNKGVRCWFSPHDLRGGDKFRDAIYDAIRLRDKVLLILSEHSINSDWVEEEVTKAFAEERERKQNVLFPVRIDDAVMTTKKPWAERLREQRHVLDLRLWKDHDAYKRSFERVLRDLTRAAEAEK
jgi:hypothetical protein